MLHIRSEAERAVVAQLANDRHGVIGMEGDLVVIARWHWPVGLGGGDRYGKGVAEVIYR